MIKKNIFLVTKSFPPFKGGIANYLFGLFSPLSKQFPVTVSTNTPSESNDLSDYSSFSRIYRSPNPIEKGLYYRIPFYFNTISCFFRNKNSFTDLFAESVFPSGAICLFLKFLNPKIRFHVFTYGSELFNEKLWFKTLRLQVLKKADNIIAISSFTHARVMQISGRNSIIINPGYNNEFYASRIHKPTDEFIILTVAKLTERKGHLPALKALGELKNIMKFKYIIIGKGEFEGKIKESAEINGISAQTDIITDASNDTIFEFYRKASVFLMPTTRFKNDIEGFGIVYLEAGAHKVPVIATNIGGVADVVKDGVNGIVVEENSVEDIKNAILLLYNDVNKRNELGGNGLKIAHDFSFRNGTEKLTKILIK